MFHVGLTAEEERKRRQGPILRLEPLDERHRGDEVQQCAQDPGVYKGISVGAVSFDVAKRSALSALISLSLSPTSIHYPPDKDRIIRRSRLTGKDANLIRHQRPKRLDVDDAHEVDQRC